jgi:2,5-diamino-6-(ribosylamino)-4(3H)-pyrimidinone 5'-phosphate reductase
LCEAARGAPEAAGSEVVQRLFPPDAEPPRSDEEPYAALDLSEGGLDRPYVVANLVSTVDGKVALGTTSRGIGSRTDRRMMRLLRSNVDALLVGAATLRSEIVDPRLDPDLAALREARGEAAQPLAVTVSRTLDLDPSSRYFVGGPERSAILTTRQTAEQRGEAFRGIAQLLTTDGDDVDLPLAFADLRRRGVRRLLCEGGPTLAERLLERGLLDEVFWTIAPKLAGGHGPGLLESDEAADRIRADLRLLSLYEHDGDLFARYRVLPRSP